MRSASIAVRRFAIRAAAASLLGVQLAAVGGDLIDHNGFEACWSQAITESAFLGAMKGAIDGVTSCVPQQSLGGLQVCDTAACSNNTVVGCQVTSHANAFTGTFAAGASDFSSTGSADNLQIHTSLGCSITVNNIVLGYTLDYTMQTDGNNGLYAASLDQSPVAFTSYTLGGTTTTCQTLATTFEATLVPQLEASAADGVMALEAPATVAESVCPLTP